MRLPAELEDIDPKVGMKMAQWRGLQQFRKQTGSDTAYMADTWTRTLRRFDHIRRAWEKADCEKALTCRLIEKDINIPVCDGKTGQTKYHDVTTHLFLQIASRTKYQKPVNPTIVRMATFIGGDDPRPSKPNPQRRATI